MAKSLKDIEGDITINHKSYNMKILKRNDFEYLKRFINYELTEKDISVILPITKNNFEKKEKIFFGVFNDGEIIASVWITIRGYQKLELGIAVSKNFRKKGIAGNIWTILENYCLHKNIDLLTGILIDKNSHLAFMKKIILSRGYEIYEEGKTTVWFIKK